jgi:hypothetical protein
MRRSYEQRAGGSIQTARQRGGEIKQIDNYTAHTFILATSVLLL